MPVNIQPATLKYKNSNGVYQSADCLKGDKGDPGAAGNAGLIAPDYDDLTFPVAKGQHCTYDGGYYEAKQNITTSETWTAAHWTDLGNVGEEIEQLKNETTVLFSRFPARKHTISHTIAVSVESLDSSVNVNMGVVIPKNTKFKMTCSCDFSYRGDAFQYWGTDSALYTTIDQQFSTARCYSAPVSFEKQYANADISTVRMQFSHLESLTGSATITVEFETETDLQNVDNVAFVKPGWNKLNPDLIFNHMTITGNNTFIERSSSDISVGFIPVPAGGYVSFNKELTCVVVPSLYDGTFSVSNIKKSASNVQNETEADAYVVFAIMTNKLSDLMAVNSQYPADYVPYSEMGGYVEKPLDASYGIIGQYYPEEIDKIKRLESISGALRFVHISDTHASGTNPIKYADQFTDLSAASFAVITGDLVNNTFANDFTNLKNQILAMTKPCYVILGNHDVWESTGLQERYDKFFNPLAEHNGVDDDISYYSVDFSTEKVKCIFLDIYEFGTGDPQHIMSQTQINWFLSELDDAITNSYHVCVFLHEPIKSTDPASEEFYDRDFAGSADLYFIADVIAAFKSGNSVSFTHNSNSYSHTFSSGGVFVAYFVGHTHYDSVGWLKGYDKQLSIAIDRSVIGSDVTYAGEKLKCIMNYVAVRNSTRQVGVIRIGNENTRYGGKKSGFWFRY